MAHRFAWAGSQTRLALACRGGINKGVKVILSIALVTVLALGGRSTAAEEGARRYLTIDDVLAAEKVHARSPLAISPDGALVAVTIQGASEERLMPNSFFTRDGISGENLGCTVRLVSLADGKITQPFGDGVYAISPVWSPDGRTLAAHVRDGGHLCVATWDRRTGKRTLHRALPVMAAVAWTRPVWFPDSQSLLDVSLRRDPTKADEDAIWTRDEIYLNDPRKLLPEVADPAFSSTIARLDLASGNVRTFALDAGDNLRIAPDGRHVAMAWYEAELKTAVGVSSAVVVLDVAAPDRRQILREGLQGNWMAIPAWSPDSRKVAFIAEGKAFVADLTREAQARMLPPPPAEAKLRLEGQPVWSDDSLELCLTGAQGAWAVDAATGAWKALDATLGPVEWLEQNPYRFPRMSHDGGALLKTAEGVLWIDLRSGATKERCAARLTGNRAVADDQSVVCGGDVWSLDLKIGEQRTILTPNSGRPPNLLTPKLLPVRWKMGGKELKGTAYLPSDYQAGTKLPTILQIYPGKEDRVDHIQPVDLLVSEGYAVFCPEILLPGKAGPLEEIVAGTEAAADAAVAAGFADPERMAVMGHSYGGYGTLCAAVGCRRFKAFAALSGMAELGTAYFGMTGYFESGQGAMGGPYWEKRDQYLANSPLERFPALTAPLLLAAGGGMKSDSDQARMAYEACVRLEKTAKLYVFDGAQHGPPAWPAHDRRALAEGLRDWFNQFLRKDSGE